MTHSLELVPIDKEILDDAHAVLAWDREYRRRLILAQMAQEEKAFLGPATMEPLGIFPPGSPHA